MERVLKHSAAFQRCYGTHQMFAAGDSFRRGSWRAREYWRGLYHAHIEDTAENTPVASREPRRRVLVGTCRQLHSRRIASRRLAVGKPCLAAMTSTLNAEVPEAGVLNDK